MNAMVKCFSQDFEDLACHSKPGNLKFWNFSQDGKISIDIRCDRIFLRFCFSDVLSDIEKKCLLFPKTDKYLYAK